MKKTHLTVILAAIFCCAVMSLIDGVIRPGYAVKSAIKIALFLGIPVLLAVKDRDLAALPCFISLKKGCWQLLGWVPASTV